MDADAIMVKEFLTQLVNEGSIESFEDEQSWTWAEVKFDNSDATIRKMATDFLSDLASSGLIEPQPIRVTVVDGKGRSVRFVGERAPLKCHGTRRMFKKFI